MASYRTSQGRIMAVADDITDIRFSATRDFKDRPILHARAESPYGRFNVAWPSSLTPEEIDADPGLREILVASVREAYERLLERGNG